MKDISRRSFFAALASLPLVKKLVPKSQRYVALDIETSGPSSTGIAIVHNAKFDRVAMNELEPHMREYYVSDNYIMQAQRSEEAMRELDMYLREAGFKQMGEGPLADCWTSSEQYKPGDVVRVMESLTKGPHVSADTESSDRT